MFNKSLCFLFLLLFSCQQKAKKEVFDPIALRESLHQVFDKHELMGMAVMVIDKGDVLWQSNFGLANADLQKPVDKNTIFRVASIAKSMTATAALQLLEQGKLALDKDVSEYLGWELKHPIFPDTPITLRLLLSHRSGIRDGGGYGLFSRDMIVKQLSIKELLTEKGSYFTEDMFGDKEPGSYFFYTNCTYGIIASIIEKVSGERFDRYCQQHIFQPLEMKGGFNIMHLSDLKDVAVIYRFKEGVWKPQVDNFTNYAPINRAFDGYELGQNGLLFGPQGSLRASAQDLANFANMLLNNGQFKGKRLLKKSSIDTMTGDQWTYNEQNGNTWDNYFLSYGFGIHRLTNQEKADIIFKDRKMIGHPGIAYGLLSDFYIDRTNKSGVIFITNGSKKDYAYGVNSTFYKVEEEVFELLAPIFEKLLVD